MQIQPRHKLIATPEGIFLDGQLLHKCDLGELPERTLNHLLCAVEIHGEMTPKDWSPPAPHGPDDIPRRVHMDIHLAMGNAGFISEPLLHKEFDPDQPRDSNGRWTVAGDTGQNGLERDRVAGDNQGFRIASNDIVVPVPWWLPVVPSRKHPEDDDPLGISSHPRRSLWPSSSDSSPEPDDDREKQCRKLLHEDETACIIPIIRYGHSRGSACLHSAMVRYGECLKSGPDGVKTPLHGVDTPL